MAKSHSVAQAKYDSTHCKYYSFKFNLENDSDIIDRLEQEKSKQGYIKQLIRQDLTRTCPGSVPVSFGSASLEILTKIAAEKGISVPNLIAVLVNEQLIRPHLS